MWSTRSQKINAIGDGEVSLRYHLKSSSTPQALVDVDLDKSSVSWELVCIGYAADVEVKQLLAKGTIAEEAALEFRMQCNSALCKATSSLLEKCPRVYFSEKSCIP